MRDDGNHIDRSQRTKTLLYEENDDTILITDDAEEFAISETTTDIQGQVLFNRYHIQEKIGSGGMGTVYLAKDRHLDHKWWAVKEIHMQLQHADAFLDEAKILLSLEHPYLPKIVDYYKPSESEKAYLVMDYIEGKTLSNVFEDANRDIPVRKMMKYAMQLCDVLGYLHNQKPDPIIYRDLKPSNIIINQNDDVKLIDFGIARHYNESKTTDTYQIGTVGFASPEQFDNKQTDHRSDIFSLGAMLYFLLSGGRYIFSTQQPLNALRTDLPQQLTKIVERLTKLDPNERYQDIKQVKKDLQSVLTSNPNQHSTSKNTSKEAFRQINLKWVSVSIIILMLLGGTYFAMNDGTGMLSNAASQRVNNDSVDQVENGIFIDKLDNYSIYLWTLPRDEILRWWESSKIGVNSTLISNENDVVTYSVASDVKGVDGDVIYTFHFASDELKKWQWTLNSTGDEAALHELYLSFVKDYNQVHHFSGEEMQHNSQHIYDWTVSDESRSNDETWTSSYRLLKSQNQISYSALRESRHE